MRGADTITDPNYAAYLHHWCAHRIQLVERPHRPLSWWGRLFTFDPWDELPAHCATRIQTTLYVSAEFRARMEFYLIVFRLGARERRAGYEVDCPHAA